MTTIAYRDGVMASDSGAWYQNASHRWARKLAKGRDGTLHGVTGHAAECAAYLAWVNGGCQGDTLKPRETSDDGNSFMVLRVPVCGQVELLGAHGVEVYDAPYFAVGAGAEVAYGALFMGATAEQAIQAAAEHGSGCFGDIRSIRHDAAIERGGMAARVERAWANASRATGAFRSRVERR